MVKKVAGIFSGERNGAYVFLSDLFIAYLSGRCSSTGQPTGVYGEDDIDALRALAEEPGITDLFLTYPLCVSIRNMFASSEH